jgi:DNA-binding LytR/AlgR family response regulator
MTTSVLTPSATELPSAPVKQLPKALRIVIVEHQKVLLRSLKRDLQRIAPDAVVCAAVRRADEACAAVREYHPHVLLLSVDMPEAGSALVLRQFPPSARSFALVLLYAKAARHKAQYAFSQTQAAAQLDHLHSLLPWLSYGALEKGAFGNAELTGLLETIRRDVQRTIFEQQEFEILTNIAHALQPPAGAETAGLMLHVSGVEQSLAWRDIAYLEGKANYWHLRLRTNGQTTTAQHHDDGNRELRIRKEKLPPLPRVFVRVHRSFVVNVECIQTLCRSAVLLDTHLLLLLAERYMVQLETAYRDYQAYQRSIQLMRQVQQMKKRF